MTDFFEMSIVDVNGRFRCVYLNNYRVAGAKPYASEGPTNHATVRVDIDDLRSALSSVGYRLEKIK